MVEHIKASKTHKPQVKRRATAQQITNNNDKTTTTKFK